MMLKPKAGQTAAANCRLPDPALPNDSASLISVIIPCRNGAAYLSEAISSILAENTGGIIREVIVADDGSTDESAAIACRFGPLIRLHAQPPLGAAAARNAGIKLATAPYLAFLDADDLWPAASLTARLACLAQSPGLAAAYGHVAQFISPELDATARARIACPPGATPARLAGAMLFRRNIFSSIGGFNEALGIGEMFDFIARFTDAGFTAACLPNLVLRRRLHASNMMRSGGAAHRGYLQSLKTVLDRRRLSNPA
jgi:glycosyltransferase involved in cell wall biosynthesis